MQRRLFQARPASPQQRCPGLSPEVGSSRKSCLLQARPASPNAAQGISRRCIGQAHMPSPHRHAGCAPQRWSSINFLWKVLNLSTKSAMTSSRGRMVVRRWKVPACAQRTHTQRMDARTPWAPQPPSTADGSHA